MFNTGKRLACGAAICVLAAITATGCSTTARSIGNGDELAKAAPTEDQALVFGKFQMVRNGQIVKLGEGLFGNSATLHLYRNGSEQKIAGNVGTGGEFAWLLEPGDYVVSNVGFMIRGDRYEPDADFHFTVSNGSDAVYVGTLTLESTFDSGYFGLSGTVDSYKVDNHCESDCANRLARLGLVDNNPTVALLNEHDRIAGLQ